MSENLLIKNLLTAAAFDHPVEQCKLLETHISWIILTGNYAYKIKKPVDFGFLDYSTLAKRKFYCEEEVRLNQFLASELYLSVVSINGSETNPKINGTGDILEYAIKMREFSQENLFSTLLQQKKLTPKLIDQLAELIAQFHLTTPVAKADSIFGTPEHVHAPVVQNFDQILPLLTADADKQQMLALQKWSEQQYKQHYAVFQARKQQGFIRDCHGDLHLGNIILFQQKPLLFDRIEFNDDLRWNDVMADIAFLAMDLAERQEFSSAKRLLNKYFSITGDYQGLTILPYYQAYRAVVRAKISLFHAQQTNLSTTEKQALLQKYRDFMQLAETYTRAAQPILFITYGVTGSGKSTLAEVVATEMGALQIRSDIVRKRLLGLTPTAQTNSAVNQGIYDAQTTENTYAELVKLAQTTLQAGYPVIIDAAFLKAHWRENFQQLAHKLNVPFVILHCHAPRPQIESWITERLAQQKDPSEAYLAVLDMQEASAETLTAAEQPYVITTDTRAINTTELMQQIKHKIG